MRRWMMKLEVEGHLGVKKESSPLVLRHPAGTYEITLEDHQMQEGIEKPLLHAYVVFDGEDLASADQAGQQHMEQFLEYLSFTTGVRFKIRKQMCLFDWSSDSTGLREGIYYQYWPNPGLAQSVIDEPFMSTIEALLESDINSDETLALHWFSSAVAAQSPRDQFGLFWFCLETLAQSIDKALVSDKCQTCADELFCRRCNAVSKHRPFRGQAIQKVFTRCAEGDVEKAFQIASTTRHALLHGGEVKQVEKKFNVTLPDVVDLVGRVAWVALLDAFTRRSRRQGPWKFVGAYPSTFTHRTLRAKAHGVFGFAAGRTPSFSEIPKVEVNIRMEDDPDGAPQTEQDNRPTT